MSLLRLSPPFKFPLHFSGSRGWLCPGGRRSRWCFPGAVAPHLEVGGQSPHTIIWPANGQAQSQRAGKYESFKPTNWRPTPSDGSAPLPINASAIRGEKAAACSWQLVPPEGGVMYAALLAGTVAPFQPSGSPKPTTINTDLSEPTLSSKTAKRRMPGDMSGPLNYKLDGTTPKVQVTNTCIPAGERQNKMPIFISRVHDAYTFLVWLRASCPFSLMAQL